MDEVGSSIFKIFPLWGKWK